MAVTSAAAAPYTLPADVPGGPPRWSVAANNGRAIAIADGAIVVQTERMVERNAAFGIVVYDLGSGNELWRREGPQPLHGTPLFLADGQNLERVDVRSGRVLWQSPQPCPQDTQQPPYLKVIDASLYVGCPGGELYRLDLTSGRVLAHQDGINVDSYQKIESLPNGTLGVTGYASIGMSAQSAILHAQTLAPIGPIQMFTPDLQILGVYKGEAIFADVCCRGTPDSNSPGSISAVSLKNADVIWSAAIHPYHPALPLSDVLPGAGVFALAGDRLYVGTRTALFVYRIGDLRTMGEKAPRRELYSDLRDRPQLYEDRYLYISEGKGPDIRRSAVFDTVAGRELWSDASRPWSAPPPTLQTNTIAEMYSVTSATRAFALMRLNDGKMLRIDTGCYLQAANERYAVTLCGKRARPLELALFDFDTSQNLPTLPAASPAAQAAQAAQTSQTQSSTPDPGLTRWTEHEWALIGSTPETYFFGREGRGIVAVNRASAAVAWQNNSVCSVARKAALINEILYVACPDTIAILDRANGRVAHERSINIYGFNAIVAAGSKAVVVEGWNDGAALRNDMAILDKNTLKTIVDRPMSDSTFLGVIGDRAYIDDWCCFGRADQYRPATIYWVSLTDGSASEPIDLNPEPNLHPARMQPLGQGARNYLQGDSFYVVTPNYTYRYDVRNLNAPPVRMVTPTSSPGP